jgi:hypothetical protein
MSHGPADQPIELPQMAARELIGFGTQFRPATNQGLKKFITVLIIGSALSACTGGAGLDVPMQPVDHGCHTGVGVDLGGDGSGCS